MKINFPSNFFRENRFAFLELRTAKVDDGDGINRPHGPNVPLNAPRENLDPVTTRFLESYPTDEQIYALLETFEPIEHETPISLFMEFGEQASKILGKPIDQIKPEDIVPLMSTPEVQKMYEQMEEAFEKYVEDFGKKLFPNDPEMAKKLDQDILASLFLAIMEDFESHKLPSFKKGDLEALMKGGIENFKYFRFEKSAQKGFLKVTFLDPNHQPIVIRGKELSVEFSFDSAARKKYREKHDKLLREKMADRRALQDEPLMSAAAEEPHEPAAAPEDNNSGLYPIGKIPVGPVVFVRKPGDLPTGSAEAPAGTTPTAPTETLRTTPSASAVAPEHNNSGLYPIGQIPVGPVVYVKSADEIPAVVAQAAPAQPTVTATGTAAPDQTEDTAVEDDETDEPQATTSPEKAPKKAPKLTEEAEKAKLKADCEKMLKTASKGGVVDFALAKAITTLDQFKAILRQKKKMTTLRNDLIEKFKDTKFGKEFLARTWIYISPFNTNISSYKDNEGIYNDEIYLNYQSEDPLTEITNAITQYSNEPYLYFNSGKKEGDSYPFTFVRKTAPAKENTGKIKVPEGFSIEGDGAAVPGRHFLKVSHGGKVGYIMLNNNGILVPEDEAADLWKEYKIVSGSEVGDYEIKPITAPAEPEPAPEAQPEVLPRDKFTLPDETGKIYEYALELPDSITKIERGSIGIGGTKYSCIVFTTADGKKGVLYLKNGKIKKGWYGSDEQKGKKLWFSEGDLVLPGEVRYEMELKYNKCIVRELIFGATLDEKALDSPSKLPDEELARRKKLKIWDLEITKQGKHDVAIIDMEGKERGDEKQVVLLKLSQGITLVHAQRPRGVGPIFNFIAAIKDGETIGVFRFTKGGYAIEKSEDGWEDYDIKITETDSATPILKISKKPTPPPVEYPPDYGQR